MSNQNRQLEQPLLWVSIVLRQCFFAIMIMWPAGTWQWWEAWVLVGLWSIFVVAIIVFLSYHDPDLLAERLKTTPFQKRQKHWDKVLMSLFYTAGLGIYIIPGFDVVRFEWSEPLPVWTEITAMILHVPCFVFLGWVMKANTFLSPVVKIDEERGHHVITTGPYQYVRHPMYSAVLILLFAVPLGLGSRFGLIPAVILMVLMVVRTYFEDRTLHRELRGYPEYSRQTPFRLIPGVW